MAASHRRVGPTTDAALIDRVYPMDQVVEAHRYVETWHKAGNVVLTIPSPTVPSVARMVAP